MRHRFPPHEQQIAEHGGLTGIRDIGLIESAVERPKNLSLYDEPDLFLIGDAQGEFTRVPVGVDAGTLGSNAIACGDIDSDGRLDVVITREGAANVLLENQVDDGHHRPPVPHLEG